MKDLFNKEWVKIAAALIVGIAIGAIFYPTKNIKEELSAKHESELLSLKQTYQSELLRVQEDLSAALNENIQISKESEQKVAKLKIEIKTLQSKQQVSTYKLVKPDGTIEERTFSASEINETNQTVTRIQEEYRTKVEQIENKWLTIHSQRLKEVQNSYLLKESQYKKEIESLSKSKITSINPKRFGVEAGISTNKSYYGHANADIWGPIFMGLHGEVNPSGSGALGLGLGIRF